jgi:hypothetical protein
MATYTMYTYETQAWLRRNPDASADQIEAAFKRIARRLGL